MSIVVGFCLSLAHYSFFLSLLCFFISSSKATKYKQEAKREVEEEFREGGMRTWLQVKPLEYLLLYYLSRFCVTAPWPPSCLCFTSWTSGPPTFPSTSGD